MILSFAELERDASGAVAGLLRELQAEEGLLDADLLRAGASANQSTLSLYLNGKRLPDPRCFVNLLTAFAEAAGHPIRQDRVDLLHAIYRIESARRARYQNGQTGSVSVTRTDQGRRSNRANRLSVNKPIVNANEDEEKRGDDREPAGEGGFEPPIT